MAQDVNKILAADSFKEIGNPIKLEHRIDPFQRITEKARTFMNYTEIVPVDWKIILSPLYQSEKERQENKAKGGVEYFFEAAIKSYQRKCTTYGLDANFAGIRIITTSESIAQEDFSNTYEDNMITKAFNQIKDNFGQIHDVMKSFGSTVATSDGTVKDMAQKMPGNQTILGASKLLESVNSMGPAAQATLNMLYEGRTLSLPKIYKTSTYTPSLSLNVRLISPYGSPKSIKKHVVEPLVYLLLLASPSTTDGLTYGKGTFLKVKCYGSADINLGYIENISIKRGGSDVTFNKHGQPLFVDVSITIKSAFSGFAAVEHNDDQKNNWMAVTTTDSVLADASFGKKKVVDGKPNFEPIETDFGFTTVDNVIRSFQKFPGSDLYTNNGLFPISNSMPGLSSVSGVANSAFSAASKITGAVSGAIANPVNTALKAVNSGVSTAASAVGDTVSKVAKTITL